MSQLMKKRFPSITSIDVGTDGNTSFLRAARNGQLEKVLEHLEQNIDINTSNANGLNALHLASKDGHVEIVKELLKRGAVIDAATKKGNTALHIASLAGQEEVVKLLVTHGASVNVQSQNGFTPLYMAAQENHDNVVKYLLANGANQSLSTEDGFTPLAVAMQQGHDKVVTVLLENDTRGKVRLPALHIAAKKDDVKAAKLLLENEHNPDVTSKSGFTPLHIASHYGNQAIANLLVQKGADVNYAAKHNITPLHVAAKWGKTNMVSVLLDQGANIESKTRDGLTPLHCAARSGHEQVVDMLLEKGAPISSKTKNGLAPLHMAAQGDHVDAARILLYHRAPVDEVTVDYLTALHVAAHCGHVRVAKLLLDRQADANARALNGFTPLHIACKKNRIKVVELLLKHGASIGATTESGLTPLHVASFMGCMNIVIYLLQHDANPDVPTVRGETPLHLAARANQTDIIRILLRNGAQVDARAREQQTPLHIASRLGNVDIVMLLLQHGAKVDNTTKDMYTALHIAAKEGQDEVAAALIDNGASLNATTKKGFTPLHLAAKYGHLKVAKLLLQKEAPVDAQGKNGVTPLHVASHYDHQNVALLLLEKGASPYATAKNGHTPLHIAAKKNQMDIANTLLEYGAKPNAESKAGFTPLHLSAQEGHCDMTDLLIEHQADTNHKARNGLTPLHLCAQEDKVPVAEILVKNGGEVDAATKNGYTPLHIACHYGQINMVRFLLGQGANVKATTSLGYTPLHQAAQQGHTNIVNTLLENSAHPNAVTNTGQTPLHIAEKLGYITVIDTLKVVTQPLSPMTASTISNDEKYRVVAPEAMHETFMSDSEEEGGEDTVLGDQTYRYLTADEMKSLGDDSLPIDVTRDERIDSNKMVANAENMLPPRNIEDNISPEHVQQNYVEYIKKYTPDNVDIDKHPISIGFLVSFLVDARGGAMRGCRHSGVRVIVPPRCASSPTRITCRYVRPQRTPHPPPLMEGEALASRVLELGPVGAKFLGPVIIEVPHFAALRGKEREIVILRSDNGESWKEHTVDATEEILNEVLHDSFEAEDLNQMEDMSSGRITRIVTQDFPQYFAVVSRVRQEVHAIGPEGGMVSSTVVPQVQAVFPQGALTKKIKVGLQAQPIDPELTAKLLGHGVAVSPVVTVEPRRRKFHKAITLSMPAPRAHSQGMINQYSGSAPTLRLLCSITGGTTRAQWEDVTGSTPLTFVNDCVSFTTTVSARFWLMDCRNVGDATKMATELYREAIHVPFMAKFVVFAKRVDPLEARLRVFCMTDDKEDKTLEHQEHFTEVAKSRDVEVLEGKPQYIEFAGNLVPITKSGEQLQFSFRAFRENRLPFSVRVKDQHAEAVSRCLFMREPKLPKGEPPQQPICILNIVLPDDIVVDTISLTDTDSLKKIENFDYYRPDPRLADMSNLLGEDWVPLAAQLGLTTSEINVIKSEYPDSVAKQAQSMLRMWLSQSGNKAQTNTLESALTRIGREDIIPQCLNVEYPHGIKEIGKQRLMKRIEDNLYDKDIMRDSESVESLKKAEEEKKKENFDKYSAEEKVVEETSDEEDFNKTVTERRHQIEERLAVDRTVPASSQRVEIVQEISSIKRQSLVENKIAVVEQKAGEVVDELKTTPTSNELTTAPAVDRVVVDADRRDSALLEGVTQKLEQKMVKKVVSLEDPKSPKVSKTPPPSPADFITKEQAAAIQEWDVAKKSAPPQDTPLPQDAEQQGLSTTTERLVASNEETLLDKPLGQQLTGLSVIDDYLATDLKTVCEQTNAFIHTESQPEPYDALADKYTRKEEINDKKVDDNKNNMNEKKKAKKGFFGSIKTFVERSFESDSESEKSPKKSKKPKKEKKKKEKSREEAVPPEHALPPRKPKLPTPPLEPIDIDSIPFAEASVNDIPPPYRPPDVPIKEESFLITDLDADLEVKRVEQEREKTPALEEKSPEKHFKSEEMIKEEMKIKELDRESASKEKGPEKSPKKDKKDKDKAKAKEKEKKEKDKKPKGKTIVVEEVTKTIEPLVIETEEFTIIVDPTKKESPKKSKETFTINIDESIDIKEKEILEKSPILPEEKIMKPTAALEMQSDAPIRPPRVRDHVYEDIEEPAVTIPQDRIKGITTDLIQNEINFGGWVDVPAVSQKVPDNEAQKEIIEKHDKEVLKEKEEKGKDDEGKKKEEKKGGFFGLFKKKDSKKEEDAPVEKVEKEQKPVLSEAVVKNMEDSRKFLSDEVQNYHDVHPTPEAPTEETGTISVTEVKAKPEEEEQKSEGFFGLFKKPKKEEKAPSEKKVEVFEKKAKKEDRKSEEKKPSVVLSEEVLKNILDSKQFLVTEVENYHDVKPDVSSKEEEKVESVIKEVQEAILPAKIVDERSPKKKAEEIKELSPKKVEKEKKEPSPKKTADDKKEPSPKPSPGFFGLFKKSKKEEVDVLEPKPILSEEALKEMKDTDEFLLAEVENYDDVMPVIEDKAEEVAVEKKTKESILEKIKEPSVEKKLEEPVKEKKVEKSVDETTESGGFFGLFKKSKKAEADVVESTPVLSKETLKEMKESDEFLFTEVENYHDVMPVIEEKAEEVAHEKKTKESILEKVKEPSVEKKLGELVKEKKVEKSAEETTESGGFFGLFKKSKKEEEAQPPQPQLSETTLKDMADTTQFLKDEVQNYHDVHIVHEKHLEEEKVTESAEQPSSGFFGLFKKNKKEDDKIVPEITKEVVEVKEIMVTEEQPDKTIKVEEEKIKKVVEEVRESSPKPGFFGLFKKSKKDEEEAVPIKPPLSDSVVKDIEDTNQFLSTEVESFDDVKPEQFESVQEKAVKVESSPKTTRGLFGIFKKSREDSIESKPVLSETVIQEMDETNQFLKDEVDNYHDVKEETVTTEREKPVEVVGGEKAKKATEEEVESSPKSSRGFFGIFKKPKKEEEESEAKPLISEAALQTIDNTKSFLTTEVDIYHDVKPEKFEPIEEVKPPKLVEDEKAKKVIDESVESSPKSSRGLFSIFKKPKKDEEVHEAKPVISEGALEVMNGTNTFLTSEVENYHDVKPEKFEPVKEDIVQVTEEVVEVSPKSRGLFGLFKKAKKDQEEVETKPIVSESVQKDITETETLLTVEVEHAEDVKPSEIEKTVTQETVQILPKSPPKGVLGKFKKTKKDETKGEAKPALSEAVVKEMDDTKQFLAGEVDGYHDVKPVKSQPEEKATRVSEDGVESSPKSSRGLFGILKKSKKDSDEQPEAKVTITEEAAKNMTDTTRFLSDEVQNYHDVKIITKEESPEAPRALQEVVEEKITIITEEIRETSPKPAGSILGIFKKSKKAEVELPEVKVSASDDFQKEVESTKQLLESTVEKHEEPVVVEEVKITTEIQETETKPEVKGGFLSKFKITKKKPSLPETQLSEEAQKSIDDTQAFISTELDNYEDDKVRSPEKEKREEKTVTFDMTKSKMVLESHLPQPEVAQVVEVVKSEVVDLVKDGKEAVGELEEVTLQEATEVHVVEEIKPSKKDKQGKDRKGFFHMFGKKTKSQDASLDEGRGRSEEEAEGSPKKQKRRKSSSPFKFFEKMKKSEEDVKELELEITAPTKIEDVAADIKDELLSVEFEDQPAMDLTEEVLGSLEKKMKELKRKYSPEAQKQMNDCRDFLFIEVDNYDDAKPVVVTDIDTGLSTDAAKAVDDVIQKAAKAVEDGKEKVETVSSETVETAAVVAAQVEETAKKAAKKAEKKSGGFFSKLGSLISGSVDDAKSELKEAKKSAEKAADKAKESTEKTVEVAAKKSKEKVEDTQRVASDKVEETKGSVKELKDSTVKATTEKVDETKQSVLKLKETLLDVTAKTGDKLDDVKKDAADKAQTVIEKSVEVKDKSAAKVADAQRSAVIAADEAKSDVVDTIQKEIDAAKQAAEESKTKAQDAVQAAVDTGVKKIDDIKTTTVEKTQAVAEKINDAKDAASKKVDDIKTTTVEKAQAVAEKIGDVKDAATKKVDDAQKDIAEKIEEAKHSTEEIKIRAQDATQTAIDVGARKIDGKVQVTTEKLVEVKDSTAKKVDEAQTSAAIKVGEAKQIAGDIKSTAQGAIQTAVDASARKVEEAKKDVSDTLIRKAGEFDAAKQKAADSILKEVFGAKEVTEKSVESGKETVFRFFGNIVDQTSKKVDELEKTKDEKRSEVITAAEKMKTDVELKAKEKADQVQKGTEAVASHLETRVQETKDQAQREVDDLAKMKDKIVEDTQSAVAQKIDDVSKAKESVELKAKEKADQVQKGTEVAVSQIGRGVEKAKDAAQQKVDDFVEAKDKIVEGSKAAVAQKIDDVSKAKESVKEEAIQKMDDLFKATSKKVDDLAATKDTFVQQKADEVKKGKESAESRLEDFGKSASQKLVEVEQIKEGVVETAIQKATDLKEAKEGVKEAVVGKIDQVKVTISEKVEDIAKVREDIKHVAEQKLDQTKTAISHKAHDAAQVKEGVEGAIGQKLDDFAKRIKHGEDVLVGKTDEAAKVKEDVKSAVSTKLDDVAKTAAREVDELKQIETSAKHTAAQKVEDLTTIVSGKKDDFAQAKETLQTQASQKGKTIVNGASKTVEEVKEKVDEAAKTAKDSAAQKVVKASQLMGHVEDAATSKLGDFTQAAAQKVVRFEEATKESTDAAETKFDDLSKKVSLKGDDLAKTKEDVGRAISEKTGSILDDTIKTKETLEKKSVKFGTDIKSSLESGAAEKIESFDQLKKQLKDGVATKVETLSTEASQKVEDLTKAKDTVEKSATQKLSDISTSLTQKAVDLKKAKDSAVGDVTKIGKDSITATATQLEDFSKTTSQKIEGTTKSAQEKLDQNVEDLGKVKEDGARALSQTVGGFRDSVEEKLTETQQQARQLEDLEKSLFFALESTVSDTAREKKKASALKVSDLDDQLAELTSSLEQLTSPIAEATEEIKSYVTPPAHRSKSHRFSREEAPACREVRKSQTDDESDEERYTVTEPEEVKEQKRKPLFHIESEEDDSGEFGKGKDRRDSIRSNVLETLSENKLDNLLSDLEVKLVEDLERSVAEGKEQTETKLSKAETELETIRKDSQADVEQIEQKLRDLDKALDSLEQASDPKLEKKLHRVERKFERMASQEMEKDVAGVSPTEVETHREREFQKLVSQLSTEEVSDFQKEYSHLWDETTFSKSDEWDSKTPDSQLDVQELSQGEESSFAATGVPQDSTLRAEGDESTSGQQADRTSGQQRSVADQHQLSEEMKQLLKELEKESKQ